MATITENQAEIQEGRERLDLTDLVKEATWKDILLELVKKEKLDPWNIDIVNIVDKYVSTVRELKVLDLHVPANIILAASMLLRFKSEVLLYVEEPDDVGEEGHQRQEVIVEPLTFRLRLPPKRRVTLPELIDALDEAMKLKEAKTHKQQVLDVPFPLTFASQNIEEEIENVYDEVKKNVDKSNMVTFSALMHAERITDVLTGLFVPLLFLAQKSRVVLIQERFFDEIIIALE